jgi:hypothetical protein
MKKLLSRITDMLADASLQEMGVSTELTTGFANTGKVHESLEENLIEVAFAEAADYDDIHNAILREHCFEKRAA